MFILLHWWNNRVMCKKKIHPSLAPPICKNFNIQHKIFFNENYVEFYFSMGTVLVIFSFFWMNNTRCPPLACPPGPPICKNFNIYRVRQHNFLFLNSRHSVSWCCSGVPVVSYERWDYKVLYRHSSVAIMCWNSEERAFAVEAYFLSGCSVIATQRAFWNRDLEWPARSPDLTPCDFLLDFLKSHVSVNCPRTLQDLKTNIQEEIANIALLCWQESWTNTRNRFTQCMENGGRHLPDVIFKTN